MKQEDIAERTHSPRGEYAANDKNYDRLLSRLKTERPVRTAAMTWMRKWSVAASVAVVCGLAWAAASHSGWTFGFGTEETQPTEQSAPASALTFADTPLSEVLTAIAARHGVSVAPLPAEADLNITAEFAPDETLDEALEALSMVSGQDFAIEDGLIVVK